jgi:hypothetical protein
VCELLGELGISDVDPQNLIGTPQRAAKEHFARALNPDGELSQIDRIRELAIAVGSIALNRACVCVVCDGPTTSQR